MYSQDVVPPGLRPCVVSVPRRCMPSHAYFLSKNSPVVGMTKSSRRQESFFFRLRTVTRVVATHVACITDHDVLGSVMQPTMSQIYQLSADESYYISYKRSASDIPLVVSEIPFQNFEICDKMTIQVLGK